jgi:hypothetical protein
MGASVVSVVAERRRLAPCYSTKTAVSFADILTLARQVLTASLTDAFTGSA